MKPETKKKTWRCFHCDEVFTDPKEARTHFGAIQGDKAVCALSHDEIRHMEWCLRRYREEDTDLHRQIALMQCEHTQALMRAEESGYAKGLKDGREVAIRFMLKIHGEFHGCLTGDCPHTSNEDCDHYVCINKEGICIGSGYIHNLIVIGLDGAIKKADDGRVNAELRRYMAEFKADPEKLRSLVRSPDTFTKHLPVYTYDGGEIVEKFCEEHGWPNVTHDGCMMYENTFSPDKSRVVQWAKRNAESGIQWQEERIADLKKNIAEIEALLYQSKVNRAKLETDFPEANL